MDRRNFLQGSLAGLAVLGAVPSSFAATQSLLKQKDPYFNLDATAQAELIRKGEVSALELVDAAIQRIELLNPKLNAVIHPMFDLAREQAKSGQISDGPFSGVPYLIKDLADLKGQPLEFGSRLFAGNVADRDLGSVIRAKQAGLVILGKTNRWRGPSASANRALPAARHLLLCPLFRATA